MLQVLGGVELTFPQDYGFSLNGPGHGQITTFITAKEMLPIVLAVAVWGGQWQGKTVRCWCDNAAVVAAVKSGWCKNKHAMHLLRCLYFFQAAYQVKLMTEHGPIMNLQMQFHVIIAQNFYL